MGGRRGIGGLTYGRVALDACLAVETMAVDGHMPSVASLGVTETRWTSRLCT